MTVILYQVLEELKVDLERFVSSVVKVGRTMASFNAQHVEDGNLIDSNINMIHRKKASLPRRKKIMMGVSLVFAYVCLVREQNNNNGEEGIFGTISRQLLFDWNKTPVMARHLITTPGNLGGHYVTLYVGNPAQPQRLVVSPTADVTAFPCAGCDPASCGTHYEEYFDPSRSKSSNIANCFNCFEKKSECVNDQCMTKELYDIIPGRNRDTADSYVGYDITDNVYLDTSSDPSTVGQSDIAMKRGFPLRFRCQQNIDHLETREMIANGVLSISTHRNSFIRQMQPDPKKGQIVAMCYHDFHSVPQPVGTSAGSVQIGNFDRSKYDSPLVYAKNVGRLHAHHPYGVHVRKIFLGLHGGSTNALERVATGEMSVIPLDIVRTDDNEESSNTVNLGSSSTKATTHVDYSEMNGEKHFVTIDSNTPTTLHESFNIPFKQAFKSITRMEYTDNMRISEEKFSLLPTILLQIESHLEKESILMSARSIPGFVGEKLSPDHPFDVLLAIPPHHYLSVDPETRVATPTVRFDHSWRSNLGAHVFQGYEVVFDVSNSRIGFAQRSKCGDGLSLLNPPPKSPKPEPALVPTAAEALVAAEAPKEEGKRTETETAETETGPVVLTSPTQDQVMTEDILKSQEQAPSSGTVVDITNAAGAQLEESQEENEAVAATMVNTGNVAGAEYEESQEESVEEKEVPQGNQVDTESAGAQVASRPELPQNNNDKEPNENQGLPEAQKNQALPQMGRAGVQSRKTVPPPPTIMDTGGLWNLLGFAMFFLGFVVTAIATRDWESDGQENSYVGSIRNDGGGDAKSVFTYSGAKSVYGAERSRGSSAKSSGKKPWPWGKRASSRDDQSVNSRSVGSFYTKGGYDGKSFYTKSTRSLNTRTTADDDQSYYTRGNQSFYTKGGDDQTYYTRGSYDDEQTYYTRDEQTRDSQSYV